LTDERDGKTYKTVKIGNQWWMAESMKYTEVPNCSNCGYFDGYDTTGTPIIFSEYGLLYGTSYEKGDDNILDACPDGWHVPDTTEWNTLFAAVGGISYADTALRATSGWDINIGTDAFGFSVLPSGSCSAGGCDDLGDGAYFWTSTYGIDDWNNARCLYKVNFFGPSTRQKPEGRYLPLNLKPESLRDAAIRCIKD
jgi:uncharacterized protein (TIGR02145 family)